MDRLNLDTSVIRRYWDGGAKAPIVARLLSLADSGVVELVVTGHVKDDIHDGPLAERLGGLPELGIGSTPRLARWDQWALDQDMLGSEAFVELEARIRREHKSHEGKLPDQRDFDHLHAHFAKGRDFFLTWDGGILALAEKLRVLGIVVMTPDEYLQRNG